MSKHIMVVDDSKTIRNLVAFVLKTEGFKVSTAEDGLDAIEKLYGLEPVDLIVSDVNMPRMDGFTFIKTIRTQDAYKDIPIIVLSTEGQEQDIQTGMSLRRNRIWSNRPSRKNDPKHKDASWLADKESSICLTSGVYTLSVKRRYGYEPGIL